MFNLIQESEYERVIEMLVEEKEAALKEKFVAERALSDLQRDTQEKDAAHVEICKELEVNRRRFACQSEFLPFLVVHRFLYIPVYF